ncbi:complement regulator-acquiring protein [Borreliella garinii]|nr:complement regulator-acquiring protein [Borreliella garinii]
MKNSKLNIIKLNFIAAILNSIFISCSTYWKGQSKTLYQY